MPRRKRWIWIYGKSGANLPRTAIGSLSLLSIRTSLTFQKSIDYLRENACYGDQAASFIVCIIPHSNVSEYSGRLEQMEFRKCPTLQQSSPKMDHGMEITEHLCNFCRSLSMALNYRFPPFTKDEIILFFRKTSLFILSASNIFMHPIFAQNNLTIGPETLSFIDGSSLIGQLREAEKEGNIVWHHKDSKNPKL